MFDKVGFFAELFPMQIQYTVNEIIAVVKSVADIDARWPFRVLKTNFREESTDTANSYVADPDFVPESQHE